MKQTKISSKNVIYVLAVGMSKTAQRQGMKKHNIIKIG